MRCVSQGAASSHRVSPRLNESVRLPEGNRAEFWRISWSVQAGRRGSTPDRENHTYKGPEWTKDKLQGAQMAGWAEKHRE